MVIEPILVKDPTSPYQLNKFATNLDEVQGPIETFFKLFEKLSIRNFCFFSQKHYLTFLTYLLLQTHITQLKVICILQCSVAAP